MNNLYTWRQFVPAKLFAVFTIVSLILSAFPVAFFVADAQTLNEGESLLITNGPELPPGHDKVYICHWSEDDGEFQYKDVPKTSIGVAHGGAGGNDGDIIPVFDNYPGQNLGGDYNGKTGAEVLAANCVVPPPVDYCDPANKPGGKSIAQWHEENQFDGSSCFEYEVTQQCGSLDVQFTSNDTPYDYAFYYAIGTETPVNWEGDGPLPVNFDEDEYGGSVDVTYYVVGPESDFFTGSDVPNFWDGNGTTVSVDTDCEELVCEADVNLIKNAGFELPVVPSWSVFYTGETGLEWLTGKNGIEIQNNVAGSPHSGNQHAELDPHHPTMIWQNVPTIPGETYTFSTYYSPRPGRDLEDNRFEFTLGSLPLGASIARSGVGNSDTDWTLETREFVATENVTTVGFRETGTDTSFGAYLDDVSLTCEPPEATLHASKIICTDEADLPNWGGGGPNIDENTAIDWVAEHDSCDFARWEFEWAPFGTADPGDTMTGSAGDPWTTFMGSTVIPADVLEDGKFWVREVLQEGFIPFTHGPEGGNSNDVTAEMYCHTDVLNYDNFDRVDNPKADGDYYCVGWNVPDEPEACTLTLVSDTDDFVVEKDDNAKELSFIHNAWTAIIDGAAWIWGDDPVVDPANDETQTFEKKFGWAGTVDSATLYVASDNSHRAELNGSLAGEATEEQNFRTTDQDEYDVSSLIEQGNNDLSVAVKNWAGNSNPRNNPAGLLYKLEITTYDDVDCAPPYEPEPEYGPYCGDGEVNQLWEQCDGTEGCTDYCTNSCSDMRLMKITLDETDSVSFDGSLHLDMAGNTIPNGTWFSFDESVGSESYVDIANAVDGLAVKRDTVNDKLALAFVGGNRSRALDIVKGSIMTLGIDFGSVDRTPNPSFKLEDGSGGSFDDVFDKTAGDTMVNFDLRADTGNDGVTVEVDAGEEYDCPECLATVEARIVPNSLGTAGDGDLSDEIILGDEFYSTVGFGEWFPISEAANPGDSAVMIDDPNTVTNFADAGNKPGLFVSREDGTVKVALYGEHQPGGSTNNEWIDARIEVRDAEIHNFETLSGAFKFEDHNGNNQPSDDYDEATADSTGVDFKMWVDTASDGFKFDINDEEIAFCEDDTEDKYLIDGYKYEGEYEEETDTVSDWPIYLYEGDTDNLVMSTTTDDEGYYYFWVGEGEWRVEEGEQFGWYQVGVNDGGDYEYTDDGPEYCYVELPYIVDDGPVFNSISVYLLDVEYNYSDYRCDFYNEQDEGPDPVLGCTDPLALNYNPEATLGNVDAQACEYEQITTTSSGGSSSGTRTRPDPQVAGASTDFCPFIEDYMQIGWENDPWEVTKLQMFLKLVMGYDVEVTGEFDLVTDVAVKLFQALYHGEVIAPWFERGIVPHDRPTGFVYKTTKWKINDIVCPGWDPYPSFDGEDLTTNVNID